MAPLGPSLPRGTFWCLRFQVVTRSALTLTMGLLASLNSLLIGFIKELSSSLSRKRKRVSMTGA